MDIGAWWATVYVVTKSQTQLNYFLVSGIYNLDSTSGDYMYNLFPPELTVS